MNDAQPPVVVIDRERDLVFVGDTKITTVTDIIMDVPEDTVGQPADVRTVTMTFRARVTTKHAPRPAQVPEKRDPAPAPDIDQAIQKARARAAQRGRG